MVMFQPEIETLSRAQIAALQTRRLQDTLRRVVQTVPFYQEALAGHDIQNIQSIRQIESLPFTNKCDFRTHYPFGLFAVPQTEIVRLHGSSGTRGKPTVVGYTKQDIVSWAECVARAIVTAGGMPADVFHIAYGYGLFTGGLGFHYGAEHLGMTVIPASGGNTPRQLTMIEDFRPRGIAATPSYVLNLAEAMRSSGLDPQQTSLEYGIFGAEPWTEEMRKTLEDMLRIKAIDVYGLSEVMGPGVGIECAVAQDGLHIAEDHFYIEIIDPKTTTPLPPGQLGEVVLTSLTKQALPVIRYRTGDMAFLYDEACRCGRTHRRMSRIKGRLDDMFIVRGVNVFPSEIESVVMGISELAPIYQIVIDRVSSMDELTTRLEVSDAYFFAHGTMKDNPNAYGTLQTRVKMAIGAALGINIQVELCPPKTLPRSEGKAVRVVDRRNLFPGN